MVLKILTKLILEVFGCILAFAGQITLISKEVVVFAIIVLFLGLLWHAADTCTDGLGKLLLSSL